MAQALTGYLPFLVLFSPPIQKEHNKQHLGTLHGYSSLGMVQDQEFKNLMLLHVHILLHMVMDMSCIYYCFQNLEIWVVDHTFRVQWSCTMGDYSQGSEHLNTLQAMESIMAEGCRIFLSRQSLDIRILTRQCCPHLGLIISKAGAEILDLMMRAKHELCRQKKTRGGSGVQWWQRRKKEKAEREGKGEKALVMSCIYGRRGRGGKR